MGWYFVRQAATFVMPRKREEDNVEPGEPVFSLLPSDVLRLILLNSGLEKVGSSN